MKHFKCTLLMDLKRSIINIRFLIAAIAVPVVYFASLYPEKITDYIDISDVSSQLYLMSDSGTFTMMLVLICTFPFSWAFCTDWKQKSIYLYSIRSGKIHYCISKVIACAVSGGLSVTIGVVAFTLIVATVLPWYNSISTYYGLAMQSQEIYGLLVPGDGLSLLFLNHHLIAFYIAKFYFIFLVCAFWAVVGMFVSVILPNPFVALVTPYVFFYFESVFQDVIHSTLPRTFHMMWSQYQVLNSPFLTTLVHTISFGGLICLFGFLFTILVLRRIDYANT